MEDLNNIVEAIMFALGREVSINELSSILDEEQNAFDNMPEGLQSSYRGMCSEDAIDSMEEASEKLYEAIELLNDIV